MREESADRANRHALQDGSAIEVLVAVDIDGHQRMALAAVDQVLDVQAIVFLVSLLRVVHANIEEALYLVVVANVAAPFIQQVVVHRVLFEYRYVLLLQSATKLCAINLQVDERSTIDLEDVIQQVR